MDTVPSRHYRPRRRSSISYDEQDEIIQSYLSGSLPQKELARRH